MPIRPGPTLNPGITLAACGTTNQPDSRGLSSAATAGTTGSSQSSLTSVSKLCADPVSTHHARPPGPLTTAPQPQSVSNETTDDSTADDDSISIDSSLSSMPHLHQRTGDDSSFEDSSLEGTSPETMATTTYLDDPDDDSLDTVPWNNFEDDNSLAPLCNPCLMLTQTFWEFEL